MVADLHGTKFVILASRVGIAQADPRRQRLALATVCDSSPARRGNDTLAYDLAGIDLTLAKAGRAPLLNGHSWHTDDLLGGIVDVWIEGAALKALVRFAKGVGEADRLWALLGQGFPLSLSLGCAMHDVVAVGASPYGGTAYRVTRWRLTELSIVVHGGRAEAGVWPLATPDALKELAGQVRSGEEAARQAMRRQLELDRWAQWASEAAARLAPELGVSPGRLLGILQAEVGVQGERLVRELAVAVLPGAEAEQPAEDMVA